MYLTVNYSGQYRLAQTITNLQYFLHFSDEDVRKNVDNAIGEVGKLHSLQSLYVHLHCTSLSTDNILNRMFSVGDLTHIAVFRGLG